MYAAISVFPWPGSKACQAPNATASANPSRTSTIPWLSTRDANGLGVDAGPRRIDRARGLIGAEPMDVPGREATLAST